jgi:membrane fusion protein, multidrug efflux system
VRVKTHVVRIALGAVLALGAGCGKESGGPPAGKGGRGAMRFPVEVAPVEARDVEYIISAVGSVEAFEQVQITARVAGVVEQVRFSEGEEVKKGQVLAEIDPARYGIAVRSAKAALEKAEAQRVEARAGADRRAEANARSPGLLPADQLDSAVARARIATAEASAARAALEQAELNLRDAYVRAPMEGVLQTRTVQTGQYVQAGAVLATLLRREPLLLRFSVPEAEVTRMKPGMPLRFTVRAEGGSYTARISHVGAAAEARSRMVRVVAEVGGEEARAPRPGAFATVTVPVETAVAAPVIPQTAVRPSERGFLVFVVEDGKARERVVEPGLRTADGKLEVRRGLRPGELLVVRGAEALKDGASVRIAEGTRPSFTGEPRREADGGHGGASR